MNQFYLFFYDFVQHYKNLWFNTIYDTIGFCKEIDMQFDMRFENTGSDKHTILLFTTSSCNWDFPEMLFMVDPYEYFVA